MTDQGLALLKGFSKSEISPVVEEALKGVSTHLTVAPLTDGSLQKPLQEIVSTVLAGSLPSGAPLNREGGRFVLMLLPQKEAARLMNSFKEKLKTGRETIFSLMTEKVLSWSVEFYLDHLRQEHKAMTGYDVETFGHN